TGSFGPYGCPENLSVRFFPNSAGSPNTAFYCKVRLFFLGVLCRVVSRKEEPSDEAVADVEADADADA
ncbi:hypothetical protein EXX75_24995, partial [Escherichia coli]